MPFPPPEDPNVCPKCGTTDCIPKAKMRIQGAGQMWVDSNELAKSCKFRQQLRQLGKYRLEKGRFVLK